VINVVVLGDIGLVVPEIVTTPSPLVGVTVMLSPAMILFTEDAFTLFNI
jgi:hypothetical protein